MKFTNPIIPGFYPDPSICRVDEDFYLVTSTFEYFPGIPIFHSRDLVNWRQIGHCLTTPGQLPLPAARCSAGIYAPTLRYHAGRFYVIATNHTQGGNSFFWADNPAGPWSEPIAVEAGGGDPSLFFDDDGQCYYTECGDRGIWQFPIDIKTGRRLAEPRHIWTGTGSRWPEAPHLYKIGGQYYLMMSEGGTEFGHMVTIARSQSPWGPFESCPYNPILTHADRPHVIQATGHADLVQIANGSWWAVFLAVRTPGPMFHHLGRETFLLQVRWTSDGWPIIGGSLERLADFCQARRTRQAIAAVEGAVYEMGSLIPPGTPASVELEMDAPDLPPAPWLTEPSRDDFDSPSLRLCWNFLRNPYSADWSLADRAGHLRLNGSAVTLDDIDSPAFVGRRQQHLSCRAAASLDFQPARVGEEAGLTVLIDNAHHYEIAVTKLAAADAPVIIVRRRIGDLRAVVAQAIAPQGPVILQIQARPADYTFSFAPAGRPDDFTPLATAATRYLTSEVAGGFTGVYIAMYATGNGKRSSQPADFDWFDYQRE